MSKPTNRRWVCPSCDTGARGPERPRKDNLVRYCLPCSGKAGKLVERTCPALDSRRSKRKRRRKKAKTKPELPPCLEPDEEQRWLVIAKELLKRSCALVEMPDVAENVTFTFSATMRTTKGRAWTHLGGRCDYPDGDPRRPFQGGPRGGVIRLNSRLFQLATEAECRNTILHEIAHILANLEAGRFVGHRKPWKEMARKLGGSDERCHEVDTTGLKRTQKRYLVTCPDRCGWTWRIPAGTRTRWVNHLSRNPSGTVLCPRCKDAELKLGTFRRAKAI